MLSKPVYLDYNATSPVHPSLVLLIPLWVGVWGNPSSIHWHGREAKRLVREARQNFASLIGCHPLEVIFTGGGSEANNTVIKGLLRSEAAQTRREIISTRVEHPSLLRSLEYAESLGFTVHYVPVNREGEFDMETYERLLSERTLLVSVMTANNETGVLFPIPKISKLAKEHGALVHTDAVQTLGRIGFNVDQMGVDFATFSGHKFYALKGAGMLYSRRGQSLENLIHGGGQERGRRAGTENLLAIASVGHMAQLMRESIPRERLAVLRELLENVVKTEVPGVHITAEKAKRLPNTTSFVIEDVGGDSLLMSLDVKGFSVSTGAACSSGSQEPSHVLLAMGLTPAEAHSSLRVSLGWLTTEEEILDFVAALSQAVHHLRSLHVPVGGSHAQA